jgi:hypothetical protein
MKIYMFRAVPLPINRSLFTVYSALLFVITGLKRAVEKDQDVPCRVSCQNKFVNLVHHVGFIIKKFVTIHGHTNVKFVLYVRIYASLLHVSVKLLCYCVLIRKLFDQQNGMMILKRAHFKCLLYTY